MKVKAEKRGKLELQDDMCALLMERSGRGERALGGCKQDVLHCYSVDASWELVNWFTYCHTSLFLKVFFLSPRFKLFFRRDQSREGCILVLRVM